MFLFKRKKSGYYYLQFRDEITDKIKAISTHTKYKPDALKFLSNLKTNLKYKSEQCFKILCIQDLTKEIINYVTVNFEHSTCQIYSRVLNDMIRIIGNKPVNLIKSKDLEDYKAKRLQEVKSSTVNIDLNTIRAIFNIAIRLELIKFNPAKNIKKLSIPQKENLCFSDVQLKAIIENIKNQSIRNIVKFAILTGCRINEIINLQWKDINFSERVLTIRNKPNFKTKTGKIRYIPISDSLLNLFYEMTNKKTDDNIFNFVNPEKYVFTKINNYKYSKLYVSSYFKRVLRSLNFEEKFHFHCIRHSFITNLIKSGVNINYVKELSGHTELQTTMNYIHISTNDLREAVTKITL
ncbi:MAG: site-specific integrase [Ignavibacteria bacterium]|nr:site-specific integrase [Ignavibacteria bacterium]